jgi:malonate decarboxylase beta subunit
MTEHALVSTRDNTPLGQSFIELRARERVHALLDPESRHELLSPYDRVISPWLLQQGIVAQFDDGVAVFRGKVSGHRAVVIATERAFLGGSIGEVSGTKIACALELACKDTQAGVPTGAVLILDTGGVRLQEANLGLAVISEIHSGIVALRQHVPVIGIVAGMVGCFGGMALSAALCSSLIMTRQGRLGMNGAEVIEQEAGIDELDSADRELIWSIQGGEQRYSTNLVDALVRDDVSEIKRAVAIALERGLSTEYRTDQIANYLRLLRAVDTSEYLNAGYTPVSCVEYGVKNGQ